MTKDKKRCNWSGEDQLMIKYHDKEWGKPVHDDRVHFEYLLLDTFQAGLSWKTILYKRENFKKAFDNFDPNKISKYKKPKIQKLIENKGIIRNKLKIESTVKNAKAFLDIQKEFGSFDNYIWEFVNNKTIQNSWKSLKDIPAKTKESEVMSKDMKNRGFSFVGPTICYAYMQAAGLVNDHIVTCFRHKELKK